MSVTRTTVVAAVAALALGGSVVASTATADAHTYGKVGSVTAKEAGKLFKETFKQRCLTMHEAQHIARGSGELTEGDPEYDDYTSELSFDGTKKSHIYYVVLTFEDDCATSITARKR
jgi:hypothetical protein